MYRYINNVYKCTNIYSKRVKRDIDTHTHTSATATMKILK